MQMGMALKIGTFKRAGEAANRPPRSSRMGIMEMIKIMISPDTLPPKAAVSPCTSESVIIISFIKSFAAHAWGKSNLIICDTAQNFNYNRKKTRRLQYVLCKKTMLFCRKIC